jgi:ferrochelatase
VTAGILLMTYGAPRDDDDVAAYLGRVLGGRVPDDALVAEMRRRYARIGGSPLVRITEAQAAALETELGPGFRVRAGMRYSEPSIAARVGELGPVERVVGVVMSPQWSALLMNGYADLLAAAATVPASTVEAWHREPAFVAALGAQLRAARARVPGAAVLLTAHSLPRRVFDAEPHYVAQLEETGRLVAAAAGLGDGEWEWAYQSAGHTQEDWLRPDLKERFPALALSGRRDVLVAPVQFLADHLEVLYDLDVAAAAEAASAGLRYHRVGMPNCDPAFIGALAAIVRRALVALAA